MKLFWPKGVFKHFKKLIDLTKAHQNDAILLKSDKKSHIQGTVKMV